jgi:hypothetical protein
MCHGHTGHDFSSSFPVDLVICKTIEQIPITSEKALSGFFYEFKS